MALEADNWKAYSVLVDTVRPETSRRRGVMLMLAEFSLPYCAKKTSAVGNNDGCVMVFPRFRNHLKARLFSDIVRAI